MTHLVDIHVGKRLKQVRTLRRLSQTDVARQLDISFQQVQKYETGSNRISASRLFELAQVLKVTPAYFFEGLENSANDPLRNDDSMAIVNALAAVDDDRVKSRIVTFIEDVSGTPINRSK